MFSIRNFVIKLLGGYTQDTYERMKCRYEEELKDKDKIIGDLKEIESQLNVLFLAFTDALHNINISNNDTTSAKFKELMLQLRLYSSYCDNYTLIDNKLFIELESFLTCDLNSIFCEDCFSDKLYDKIILITDKINKFYLKGKKSQKRMEILNYYKMKRSNDIKDSNNKKKES